MKKRFLFLSLLAAAVFCMPMPAFAGQAMDPSAQGSLSVTLADPDTGKPVAQKTVRAYRVASVQAYGTPSYALTPDFSASGVVAEDLLAQDNVSAKAKALAAFAEKNPCEGLQAQTDADGAANFHGMQLGIYLVTAPAWKAGLKTYQMQPFLVQMPLADEKIGWNYVVGAAPKISGTAPVPPAPDPVQPGAPLPQTGTLNWPVPLLVIGGVLFVMAGWAANRKQADGASVQKAGLDGGKGGNKDA